MLYPAVIVAQLVALAAGGTDVARHGWSWNPLMLAPEFWGRKYALNAKERVSEEEFKADLDVLRARAEGGLLPACGLGRAGQEVCNAAKRGELEEEQAVALRSTEDQARELFSVGVVFERLRTAGNWLSAALTGGKEKLKDQEAENSEVKEEISKTQQVVLAAQEQAQKLQQELEEARRSKEEAKRSARQAEEQLRLFSARADGDPILCTFDQDGKQGECVRYRGPAITSCFAANGDLTSIHFVGVCNQHGTKCQTPEADWVGEHWQLDMKSLTWSYRDVRGSQKADLNCARITSQAAPDARPDEKWLEPFKSGRSFMIHELQPTVMEGPDFATVWRMISSPDQSRGGSDETHVGDWTNAMLSLVGHAQRRGMAGQTRDIAMMSLAYGLASGAKKANFLPVLAKA